jgi:hypothetical protein
VFAVGELLDEHVPPVHVDVLDDELVGDERPPRQVDEDPPRRHERTVGRLEAFDPQIVDFERAGEEADLQLLDVRRPIEPGRRALLRFLARHGTEIDRHERDDRGGDDRRQNAQHAQNRMLPPAHRFRLGRRSALAHRKRVVFVVSQ